MPHVSFGVAFLNHPISVRDLDPSWEARNDNASSRREDSLLHTRILPLILAAVVAAGAVAAVYAAKRAVEAAHRQGESQEVQTAYFAEREQIRLLAAIVPHGERTWFFHLWGPTAAIAHQEKAFQELLASVHFDPKNEPPLTWKAPKGWTEERGAGLRAVTFRFTGPPELEIKVFAFGRQAGTVLDNVNRWREQLNVPPLETVAELDKTVRKEMVGGSPAFLVDVTGLGTHHVSAPVAHLPRTRPGPPNAGPPAAQLPFTYELPKGWQRSPRRAGISRETLLVGDETRGAILTMTPAGGDLAANINRWRGQLDLPKLSADEAIKSATELTVDGKAVRTVDLISPKAQRDGVGRFLVAVVPLGEQTWFLKMYGPADVVGAHKGEFESLIKSLKFGGR